MSDVTIGVLCLVGSLVLIQSGMNIGVALMLLSFVGVLAIKGLAVAGKLLASSVTTSIASDAYAVIPLFVLMGLFVSATNMGRDTFDVAARLLRGVRGGLGIATVAANAVFAACTGTTIASASVFTKVAVPEMIRHGHTPLFSVGVVAGSSVLGMLIPPSILMIIFGVIANVSIADLFTAGILPGILLAAAFCVTIVLLGYFRPQFVASEPKALSGDYSGPLDRAPVWLLGVKFLPIALLVGTVLGGIYGGFFTPTEAGGAGALAAFLIALARRELTIKIFWEVALEAGRVTAAICFLLMAAALYSQMLTLSGLPYVVGQWLQTSQLGYLSVLVGYLAVVIVLGCFLDFGLDHADRAAVRDPRVRQLRGQSGLARADQHHRHRDRLAHAAAGDRGIRGQGQSRGSAHLNLGHFQGDGTDDADHVFRAGPVRAVSVAGVAAGRAKMELVVTRAA